MSDIIIIGAGLSGMTSAIALAKAGHSVTIVEKSSHPAPVISSFKWGGYWFDCAFHYTGSLGPGEYLSEMLNYLGIYDRITPKALDPDGFDIIRIQEPSCQIPIPWGWDRLKETLSNRFPEDREGITRYLNDVREVYQQIPAGLTADHTTLDELWDEGMGPTLQEYLDDMTSNQVLQRVLSAQSILYGMSPDETPFTIHARIMGSYYQSAYAVEGGGGAIVKAFTDQLDELGITLRCGVHITRFHADPTGNIESIECADGQHLRADQFVYSGHPKLLADLLPETSKKRVGRRLRRLEDTLSAMILFCKTDSSINLIRNRNLFVRKGLERSICDSDLPISDRGFFVSYGVPDDNEPESCSFTLIFPDSHSTVTRWKDSEYGARPAEYWDFKAQISAELLARFEEACPEFAGRTEVIEMATPLTIKYYCTTPETAGIYGVKHQSGRIPVLPQCRIPNLFITGQAVVTPGLFGAVYSGLLTAGVMTGTERYKEEIFNG